MSNPEQITRPARLAVPTNLREIVEGARSLVRQRVDDVRELEFALDLLDRCVTPPTSRPSDSAPNGAVLRPKPLSRWIEPGVMHAAGAIDRHTAADFLNVLRDCDADPTIVALDLSGVEFFSAAGVRCFVQLGWPERPHASVIASRAVRRILLICDMEFLLAPHGWRDAFDGWMCDGSPAEPFVLDR